MAGTAAKKATKASKKKKLTALKKVEFPNPELEGVYDKLYAMLKPYEKHLTPSLYDPRCYMLETLKPSYDGKPQCFAGLRTYKTYIGFYFMPVYMFPEIEKGLSIEMRKRKQGKSCFNFNKVDATLFQELKEFTKMGFERFKKEKLL